MIACGHDAEPFGNPICAHLRERSIHRHYYLKWYTGTALDVELLCRPCADARRDGARVVVSRVCESCFRNVIEAVGEPGGARGEPGILIRSEPFETTLRHTALPRELRAIADLAPIQGLPGSRWLLLMEDGSLAVFDADTLESTRHARTTVPAEPERKRWNFDPVKRRLHVSARAEFAAVVNDFGRWGQVLDLRSGRTTLDLDGDDYHCDTVPLSFAFAEVGGRTLVIHRTQWNRLDISDPATGAPLTGRGPTSYSRGEPRPEHYLDFFHGALLVSPGSKRIVDDGWAWHPVGVVYAWHLERWLENVWESEDGPSRLDLFWRDCWNGPMTWLDDDRVAAGGLDDDEEGIPPGARVFDLSAPEQGGRARELRTIGGPAGTFFSDGNWLFSSNERGLSRWDTVTGERTGHLPAFSPSRYHRGARELVELRDGSLVRLAV